VRHYKTARTILRKSLEDIEAGHWKRGHLAVIPAAAFNGEFYEDGDAVGNDVVVYVKDACDVQMGCAVGLVAMYGGIGEPLKRGFFQPEYPSRARNKVPGVEQALRALYDALPARRRYEDSADLALDDLEYAVIDYNDERHVSKKTAANWFRKALEIVGG
jgi:hypothetical protein